jgi:hypothetical protein
MIAEEYVAEQVFEFDETGFVEGLFWDQFRTLTRNTR